MQSSRKSFKAYSVAQPLKKEIDDTLIKVQLQKRKFLTLEREEAYLRDFMQKKRKQLHELKAKEPQTKVFSSKAWQTNNIINHVDKTYMNTYDSIQTLKNSINLHRRQIAKYKSMNIKLYEDTNKLDQKNNQINNQNLYLENNNEKIKDEIIQYRQLHMKNINQFQKSHTHINKSNFNEENQRRIFSMKQKSFLGEQMKNSKIIPFDNLSDQLRNSGIRFSDNSNEIMTESLPLAKERIKIEIIKNKEKLKIAQNYKRFGQSIENMFQVMKQYKGRDDLDFIAQEFVTKQKQLQKIEEYVSQLESRIQQGQNNLRIKKQEDQNLNVEINTKIEKSDAKYILMQQKTISEIEGLKAKEGQFIKWFGRVGQIIMPLVSQPLTRNNASDLIGNIEMSLSFKKQQVDRKPAGKPPALPNIDLQQKQSYNELMNYDKMRQFAADFVKSKKYS